MRNQTPLGRAYVEPTRPRPMNSNSKREHGRHDANGSVIRWCFADPAIAQAFADEFSALRAKNDRCGARCRDLAQVL